MVISADSYRVSHNFGWFFATRIRIHITAHIIDYDWINNIVNNVIVNNFIVNNVIVNNVIVNNDIVNNVIVNNVNKRFQ